LCGYVERRRGNWVDLASGVLHYLGRVACRFGNLGFRFFIGREERETIAMVLFVSRWVELQGKTMSNIDMVCECILLFLATGEETTFWSLRLEEETRRVV